MGNVYKFIKQMMGNNNWLTDDGKWNPTTFADEIKEWSITSTDLFVIGSVLIPSKPNFSLCNWYVRASTFRSVDDSAG